MEGVDRHEYDVAAVVDELYHLLRMTVDLGAQQSGELADTVVDMNDIVARLDRAEFFERHGELSRAGAVALEAVFMETVENLMVSEHAGARRAVDETGVKRSGHGSERNIVAAVGEDGLQTFVLVSAVAENI